MIISGKNTKKRVTIRFKTFIIFMLLVLLLTCSQAEAILYKGIRPLGMGNAFTALADDKNALFYNPAGLSGISNFGMDIFNPLVEVSKNSIDLASDAGDTDFDETIEVADLLRKYTGESQFFRIGLFPNAAFRIANAGAMVGILGQGRTDIQIRNPVWPEAHVNMIADYGTIGGAGLDLPFPGWRVGGSLKIIGRESLSEVYTAADIASENFEDRIEDDLQSGSGVSIDIGAIYDLPDTTMVDKLSFGICAQNLPSMKMGDAQKIESQVNVGTAVRKTFDSYELTGTLDIHDITKNATEHSDFAKRLHAGAEFRFPMILSLRTGLNQGYLTGGITFDFHYLRFDFATYAEEVGTYAGQKDNRRYCVQMTTGW